ncbi:MAG: EamA family transporter RarD, partial [Corynebacterium sp.]
MLQYLTPVMQMLWAVLVVGEYIEPARWVGFAVIWVALLVFVTDTLINARRTRLRKLV